MVVTWDNSKKLKTIRIDDSDKWNDNKSSPVTADITDFHLDTPASHSIDYLEFSGDMRTVTTISIQFIMTDGSSKTLTVYPASSDNSFIVKATGKTASSNIYRTIQANYNAQAANITSYNEINTEITP